MWKDIEKLPEEIREVNHRVYFAHPPKTSPKLKEAIIHKLSQVAEVVDPFGLNPNLESASNPRARAVWAPKIFADNVRAISSSHAVVALVSSENPFDPDQGVFWELGLAKAWGLPAYLVVVGDLRPWKGFSSAEKQMAFLSSIGPVTDLDFDPRALDFGSPLIPREVSPSKEVVIWVHPEESEEVYHLVKKYQRGEWSLRCLSYDSDWISKGLYAFNLGGGFAFFNIDDRPAMASFLMGYHWGNRWPYWTWSARGYGSNIMIAQSSRGHFSSLDELLEGLKKAFWEV